jgi:putative glutamine amidotransferase
VLPKKTVHIEVDSRLHRITGCNPCRVNALHHQSVDRVGRGLRVVARDEAGIVQAIEGTGEGFLVGVQWHPELLVFAKPQQRLFAALTAATRGVVERAAEGAGPGDPDDAVRLTRPEPARQTGIP